MIEHIISFLTVYNCFIIVSILLILIALHLAMPYLALLCAGIACSITIISIMNNAYLISYNRILYFGKVIITLGLAGFIISFIVVELLIINEFMHNQNYDIKADYVIILGAGLDGDKVSSRLENRLLAGVEYLLKNKMSKVVVSGGQGKDELIPEAEAMGNYLIARGIEEERILYESKSKNTLENLIYSRQIILSDSNIQQPVILIVSSNYHIFRGKMISKKLGFETYSIGCSSQFCELINGLIREYVGVVKDSILTIAIRMDH